LLLPLYKGIPYQVRTV